MKLQTSLGKFIKTDKAKVDYCLIHQRLQFN